MFYFRVWLTILLQLKWTRRVLARIKFVPVVRPEASLVTTRSGPVCTAREADAAALGWTRMPRDTGADEREEEEEEGELDWTLIPRDVDPDEKDELDITV